MLLIFNIYLTVCMCYLQAPCEGRGCRGGCPCGRGAATRGAPSRGTGTAATRPGSARGRSVYKGNLFELKNGEPDEVTSVKQYFQSVTATLEVLR